MSRLPRKLEKGIPVFNGEVVVPIEKMQPMPEAQWYALSGPYFLPEETGMVTSVLRDNVGRVKVRVVAENADRSQVMIYRQRAGVRNV